MSKPVIYSCAAALLAVGVGLMHGLLRLLGAIDHPGVAETHHRSPPDQPLGQALPHGLSGVVPDGWDRRGAVAQRRGVHPRSAALGGGVGGPATAVSYGAADPGRADAGRRTGTAAGVPHP